MDQGKICTLSALLPLGSVMESYPKTNPAFTGEVGVVCGFQIVHSKCVGSSVQIELKHYRKFLFVDMRCLQEEEGPHV
jgi:hypothetical protein